MQIKSITINKFRRFEKLIIKDLPPARLVVLAGPNGSGKSSLFDAMNSWQGAHHVGLNWDEAYHSRVSGASWQNNVEIAFHNGTPGKKSIYMRSAYRNDADFRIDGLSRQREILESLSARRMIDQDATVRQNYQRLASTAFEDAFATGKSSMTLEQFRREAIGEISDSITRLFPDLELNTLGNPLEEGTFTFAKGSARKFHYKNLSGGEKAAFDLLLDLLVKRRAFDDTVFAIDEPEVHMSTRLQGRLLEELFNLVPSDSQLWIATHSIGMMKKARDLHKADPEAVVFLDFEGHDFDNEVRLHPVEPNRAFWERVLRVALDDLADLVAPSRIIICEGNPKTPTGGKNEEHDARCYQAIFDEEFADVKFVSAGSSREVTGDRLKFAAAFPSVVKGTEIIRLIDRDDHSESDVADFTAAGIRVTGQRNIEAYLYSDEILSALCEANSASSLIGEVLERVAKALNDSVDRGNPPNDLKSAANDIYRFLQARLKLFGKGNDQMSFARNVLVPLVSPSTNTYKHLRAEILGD